jgi:PAS domain S-box-containing protein
MIRFSSDMIIMVDSDHCIIDVNDRFIQVAGERREALIGQRIEEISSDLLSDLPVGSILNRPGETKNATLEKQVRLNGADLFFRYKLVSTIYDNGTHGVTIIIEDITERERAERKRAESEELYRSVLENIQDVFYRSDGKGDLIMASPSWASLLGYATLDECLGKNIAEIFYYEPLRRADLIDEIMKNGAVSDYEVVLKRRDGTPLHVSTNSHLIYDKAGAVAGIEGIFREATERQAAAKKKEASLATIRFRSQTLLEFIELPNHADIFEKIGNDLQKLLPDAMIIVNSYDNATGTVTIRSVLGEAERNVCIRWLGRDPVGLTLGIDRVGFSSLSGSNGLVLRLPISLYELAFRRIPAEICEKITRDLDIGEIFSGAFVRGGMLFGNTLIFFHAGSGTPDLAPIEAYIHQASIALQRRIAEDALRQSEVRYRGIVEDQTELILRYYPDGTISFANDVACRYFQKEKQDLAGSSFPALIPAQERAVFSDRIRSLDQKNPVVSLETPVYDPSGRVRWQQWTTRALFDERGNVEEYQAVGRDITEQHEASARCRKNGTDIGLLSYITGELLELPPEADIYEAIGRGLTTLIPDAVISMVALNPVTHVITNMSMLGHEERGVFKKYLGTDPVGIAMDPATCPPSFILAYNEARSGRLIKIPGDLYFTMLHQVPEPVCQRIEKELDIGDIYGIGFALHTTILGAVTIMLKKGHTIPWVDLIETYMRIATLALDRRLGGGGAH